MDDLSLSTCIPPRLLSQPIADPSPVANLMLEPSMRHELIAQAAYFRAQRRAFRPGHELEDWRAAEVEVDTGLQTGDINRTI
jgi:Protein of unknown function (DUF2934)